MAPATGSAWPRPRWASRTSGNGPGSASPPWPPRLPMCPRFSTRSSALCGRSRRSRSSTRSGRGWRWREHGKDRPVTGARRVHRYPRAARLNEVLREVLAEELERLADADDRLGLLTVTAVNVDPDLRHATVLLASISDDARVALDEDRVRLQAAVAPPLRLRRTPLLSFEVDPAITTGSKIEEILRGLHDDDH